MDEQRLSRCRAPELLSSVKSESLAHCEPAIYRISFRSRLPLPRELETEDEAEIRTSGQDGGVGRYTLPPRTTKRRTTNLKTKSNQNCRKTELCGSPTIKEIKKTHSSRPVGGAETGSQTERTRGKASAEGRVGKVATDRAGSPMCVCR